MNNLLAALLPYAAVLGGMYGCHSAWLAIGLYHVGIVAFLIKHKPAGLGERISTGYRTPMLLPGLVICALAAPVVYVMWPLFSAADGILPDWLARYRLSGSAWLLFIPYFSIVHPVLEEILWRKIDPKPFRILCWQDLLFAGYHVLVLFKLIKTPWLVLVFAVLAGSSIFWRWAVHRTGGYGMNILTHAVADAGVMIAVVFLLGH